MCKVAVAMSATCEYERDFYVNIFLGYVHLKIYNQTIAIKLGGGQEVV